MGVVFFCSPDLVFVNVSLTIGLWPDLSGSLFRSLVEIQNNNIQACLQAVGMYVLGGWGGAGVLSACMCVGGRGSVVFRWRFSTFLII